MPLAVAGMRPAAMRPAVMPLRRARINTSTGGSVTTSITTTAATRCVSLRPGGSARCAAATVGATGATAGIGIGGTADAGSYGERPSAVSRAISALVLHDGVVGRHSLYYAKRYLLRVAKTQQQYEVVAPPDGVEASAATQPPPSNDLFVYPSSGQSAEQQSKDRTECQAWASGQTGFNPTMAGGGVAPDQAVSKRNDYFRAQVSCLEGRGYTVR